MAIAFRLPSRRSFALAPWGLAATFTATLGISQQCQAGGEDAFYHQLLKTETPSGYQPTRSFTIVTDAEHGNQLVAEDDPNLRFNLAWMQQFQPGYKSRRGGSAFGEIFRSYLKTAYKSYRDHNAQSMSALPDENGSGTAKSFTDVDYNLKVTSDEVRFKVGYSF
jgi:hypothetical protein